VFEKVWDACFYGWGLSDSSKNTQKHPKQKTFQSPPLGGSNCIMQISWAFRGYKSLTNEGSTLPKNCIYSESVRIRIGAKDSRWGGGALKASMGKRRRRSPVRGGGENMKMGDALSEKRARVG